MNLKVGPLGNALTAAIMLSLCVAASIFLPFLYVRYSVEMGSVTHPLPERLAELHERSVGSGLTAAEAEERNYLEKSWMESLLHDSRVEGAHPFFDETDYSSFRLEAFKTSWIIWLVFGWMFASKRISVGFLLIWGLAPFGVAMLGFFVWVEAALCAAAFLGGAATRRWSRRCLSKGSEGSGP